MGTDHLLSKLYNKKLYQEQPLLREALGLGGYEYNFPEDVEQRVYDFYFLSLIGNPDDLAEKIFARAWDKSGFQGAYFNEQQTVELTNTIKRTQEKIFNYYQQDLLDAVFFSIAAEIKHTTDTIYHDNATGKPLAQTILLARKYSVEKQYIKWYKNWTFLTNNFSPHKAHKAIKKYSNPEDPLYNLARDVEIYEDPLATKVDAAGKKENDKEQQVFFKNNSSRIFSYIAAKKAFDSKYQFINFAEKCFLELSWQSSFGGTKWADICKGWKYLNNAKKPMEQMIWIDHVFDLEHNNNVVLDKVQRYAKNCSWNWIKKALDYKKHESIPMIGYFDKMSPDMIFLAKRIRYALTGIAEDNLDALKPLSKILDSEKVLTNNNNNDAASSIKANTNYINNLKIKIFDQAFKNEKDLYFWGFWNNDVILTKSNTYDLNSFTIEGALYNLSNGTFKNSILTTDNFNLSKPDATIGSDNMIYSYITPVSLQTLKKIHEIKYGTFCLGQIISTSSNNNLQVVFKDPKTGYLHCNANNNGFYSITLDLNTGLPLKYYEDNKIKDNASGVWGDIKHLITSLPNASVPPKLDLKEIPKYVYFSTGSLNYINKLDSHIFYRWIAGAEDWGSRLHGGTIINSKNIQYYIKVFNVGDNYVVLTQNQFDEIHKNKIKPGEIKEYVKKYNENGDKLTPKETEKPFAVMYIAPGSNLKYINVLDTTTFHNGHLSGTFADHISMYGIKISSNNISKDMAAKVRIKDQNDYTLLTKYQYDHIITNNIPYEKAIEYVNNDNNDNKEEVKSENTDIEYKKINVDEYEEIPRKGAYEVTFPNGTKAWYVNKLLHKKDGPAKILSNGSKYWYLNGIQKFFPNTLEVKPGDISNSTVIKNAGSYTNILVKYHPIPIAHTGPAGKKDVQSLIVNTSTNEHERGRQNYSGYFKVKDAVGPIIYADPNIKSSIGIQLANNQAPSYVKPHNDKCVVKDLRFRTLPNHMIMIIYGVIHGAILKENVVLDGNIVLIDCTLNGCAISTFAKNKIKIENCKFEKMYDLNSDISIYNYTWAKLKSMVHPSNWGILPRTTWRFTASEYKDIPYSKVY